MKFNQRGAVSLHLILTIFLGLGMVLFGVLAVLAYSDNQNIHATLDSRLSKAKTQAAEEQKKADADANAKANQLPYRTYVADAVDGSFQLQIPKNWSIYAARNNSGNTQLELFSDLDVVNQNASSGAVNSHALQLDLLRRSASDVMKDLDARVKKKKLTSKQVTVSGITGTRYEGAIDDQHSSSVVIVLQVRDKTITLTNANSRYINEFNTIVTGAKFNP